MREKLGHCDREKRRPEPERRCQTGSMGDEANLPHDTPNEIGVLKRREIEARIVMSLIQRLDEECGRGVGAP